MSYVLMDKNDLTKIADKIREVTGSTELISCNNLSDQAVEVMGGSGTGFITNKLNGALLDATTSATNATTNIYQYKSSTPLNKVEIHWPSYPSTSMSSTIDFSNNSSFTNSYYSKTLNQQSISTTTTTNFYFDINTLALQIKNQNGTAVRSTISNTPINLTFYDNNNNKDFDSCLINYRVYYCYLKDTLITLANNSTKKVQDITYQDDLLVWDFDNGCYTSAKPVWIKKAEMATQYYHCVFENGNTLNLVGGREHAHRIFCLDTNQFEYANDCVNKIIMTQNGPSKLISCDIIEDTAEYYNIITNYHMNVYTNQILTSTGFNNLYPIKNMKFIKEKRELIPIEAFNNCPQYLYDGLRLGEQVNYSMERLNEKIAQLVSSSL